METKVYFPNAKGNKLCGILSNPTGDISKPIIIMLHGFTSSKKTEKLVTLQKIFDDHDISSLRFDAYAHGESEGSFANLTVSEAVADVLSAIRYVNEQGYTKIGLIGSSFGGLASIMAAAKTNALFVLALFCPVSDYEEVEKRRKTKAEMEEWRKKGYRIVERKDGQKLKLSYQFFEDLKNNRAYDVAHNILIPTLIVHGDADDDVPVEQSMKTAKLIPDCRLEIIKRADHLFSNPEHFQKMITTVSNFILEHTNTDYFPNNTRKNKRFREEPNAK